MTQEEIKSELREGRVLVKFFANWCGPCKALSPIVEKLSNEQDEVKILSIDIDEHHETASAFNVRGVPTLTYLEDGEVINSTTGMQTLSDLKKLIKLD